MGASEGAFVAFTCKFTTQKAMRMRSISFAVVWLLIIQILRDVDVCTAKLGDSISSRDGVAVPANNERATVPSSGIKFLVGKCDLDEYFTKLHECQLIFYESDLATNSTAASCKQHYEALRSCYKEAFDGCLRGSWLLDMLAWSKQLQQVYTNMDIFLGDETCWCVNGGLELSPYIIEGMGCDMQSYLRRSQNCVAKYQVLYRSKTSDRATLCREHSTAKLCLRRQRIFHCRAARNDVAQLSKLIMDHQLKFLPFCTRHQAEEMPHEQPPADSGKCPPWFSSDVILLTDVASMAATRQAANCMLSKFNYGSTGIEFGVVRYQNRRISSLIQIGRSTTEEAQRTRVLRNLHARGLYMGRYARASSQALRYVEGVLTRRDDKMYPPVVVVFMKYFQRENFEGFMKHTVLIDNDDIPERGGYCTELMNEICFAARHFNRSWTVNPEEHHHFDEQLSSSSFPLLQLLYHKTSRLGVHYLPLLWLPTRISGHEPLADVVGGVVAVPEPPRASPRSMPIAEN